MKTYNITTKIDGILWDLTIEGEIIGSCYGFYQIHDKDGKNHYFPTMFTVIREQ
jgi:hypothetical protein